MDTKLTLNVNKSVIERAKEYAKSHKISLSKLIETYLASLTNKKSYETDITPLVESLIGVIELDKDFDYKNSYSDFLMEKYK